RVLFRSLFDVCRMTPPSQNVSHTHQNQTFPSKPTISAQLKMYVFSFIQQWITRLKLQLPMSTSATINSTFVQHPHSITVVLDCLHTFSESWSLLWRMG